MPERDLTPDEVKDLVRRYIDGVWNRGTIALLDALTTPDFQYRLGGQPARDRAAMALFIHGTHVAFPDWHVEIADLIAQSDRAAVRWHGLVTHGGPFRNLPPTGRRIAVSGISVYRIVDGRIAAEWEQMDSIGMLQQLGAVPAS